jgi:uncharacterized membrane protein
MALILKRLFVAGAVMWAAALPLATWMASAPGHPSAGYAFAAAVYGASSWICHQRPERSFFIWATQMPVCARCTAIYAGGAVAAVLFGARRSIVRASTARDRAILIAAVAPSILTLIVEFGFGRATSNLVRALAGLPIGAVVAWVVLRAEVN